jgi:hypothetical protein
MPWFFVGSDPPALPPVPDNWVAKSVAIRGAMAEGNLTIKKGKGGGEGLRGGASPKSKSPGAISPGL